MIRHLWSVRLLLLTSYSLLYCTTIHTLTYFLMKKAVLWMLACSRSSLQQKLTPLADGCWMTVSNMKTVSDSVMRWIVYAPFFWNVIGMDSDELFEWEQREENNVIQLYTGSIKLAALSGLKLFSACSVVGFTSWNWILLPSSFSQNAALWVKLVTWKH